MSHCWQNTLILETSSIKQALEAINNEALRVAIVVDEENRLKGTLTDGDVRRGLLNEITISEPVSAVMNSNPVVAFETSSKEQVVELMEENQILSIPLINSEREVVGLETLYGLLRKERYDNPVFLMAGGFGTRLRPLTDNCPKPLLKVGEKPILETLLLSFINAGFHNFYISTHYLPEMIREYFGNGEKWGVTINYVYEEKPLGTGGALGLLPKSLPDLPVIMMNGDILTKVDVERLLNFHNLNNANATMCVREYEYKVPFGVIENEGNEIKSMVEKPTHRFHVNAGIYVVSRKIIDSVLPNEIIDMPTLLERHLGNKILMFPFYEYWLDIGRMDDFERAQVDILSLGL
ncbi:nucleotidyltransferase family protein [Catenovulum maritimum]|uniref:Alcohol dehydrogenase n=1 Tax=Catenovulum maritimum TaxID=1513271 RepID=A0A0J8GPM7_9ALTE|nr:nucleotidyltransferase family protein [Catenovulum maritimum]KMT64737.1 alcohol dehydrogenase [Catenovulum maritimum]